MGFHGFDGNFQLVNGQLCGLERLSRGLRLNVSVALKRGRRARTFGRIKDADQLPGTAVPGDIIQRKCHIVSRVTSAI